MMLIYTMNYRLKIDNLAANLIYTKFIGETHSETDSRET